MIADVTVLRAVMDTDVKVGDTFLGLGALEYIPV